MMNELKVVIGAGGYNKTELFSDRLSVIQETKARFPNFHRLSLMQRK